MSLSYGMAERVLREASLLLDEVRHFVDGHSIGVCHRPMLGFGPLGVPSSLVFVVLFVLARQLLAVRFLDKCIVLRPRWLNCRIVGMQRF